MREVTPKQIVAFMTNVIKATPEQTIGVLEGEIERLQTHSKSMIDALNADIDTKHAEIERLKALVKELADELDVLVEARYSGTKGYPSELRRYERDIEPVKRARAALENKP
jgi:uncharacterized protein YoxC